jgi:membrane protein YdbS with pleckstrin-like domain
MEPKQPSEGEQTLTNMMSNVQRWIAARIILVFVFLSGMWLGSWAFKSSGWGALLGWFITLVVALILHWYVTSRFFRGKILTYTWKRYLKSEALKHEQELKAASTVSNVP